MIQEFFRLFLKVIYCLEVDSGSSFYNHQLDDVRIKVWIVQTGNNPDFAFEPILQLCHGILQCLLILLKRLGSLYTQER